MQKLYFNKGKFMENVEHTMFGFCIGVLIMFFLMGGF